MKRPPQAQRARLAPLSGWLRLALCCLAASPVTAQTLRADAEVTTTATATNNSRYSDSGDRPSDLVLDVAPRVRLERRGARLDLSAEAGLNALHYTGGTRPSRVLPEGRLRLRSEPVEQWVHVDADALVEQSATEAFSGRAELSSSVDLATTTRLRLAPYVERRLTSSLSLLARTEHDWTRREGDELQPDQERVYQQRHLVRLARQPLPFGFDAEWSKEDASYGGDSVSALEIETLRAVASYAFDPELVLGVIAGHERSSFFGSTESDGLYGLRLQWAPTERTALDAVVERRFLGTGWQLRWQHRSPFIAFHLSSSRQPVVQGTSQELGEGGGDVASLLDAILTTRHPDPVQRAALVQDMIQRLGLPTQLIGPVELFSNYAQLEQDTTASIALLGRRTTLTASVYMRKLERLRRDDDPFAGVAVGTADSEQRGLLVNVNRRLTPTTQGDVRLSWTQVEGLGLLEGSRSREKALRVSLHHNLSPRSFVTFGVRRQLLDSNVSGPSQESAAFAGLGHRF
ncbi:TIGR03016 family PEP-CTERM system-associated outer membrane protein [Caldimonas brevitalea]|uniref:Glycine-rich cell wall structural protein n=1 Tax=Caldimonas brevitalea TaxID=413882 RepID=A0A0G3BRC4_9BURK|nr:TIGR03016 family PEP-CTERM system-associated outer membrane protein [Caldimonas brevitalea]AKJ29906.1 glycine-rich cell wall structural protein [Caldimonas brevitalea]